MILFALTALSFVALDIVRRLVIAWATYRAAARMRATTTLPNLGPVRLRGRLGGGNAITVVQETFEAADRSDAIWLEREGERIAILGPVRVEHGSRIWSWWWRAPRRAPVAFVKAKYIESIARAVTSGDEVVVTGVMQQHHTGVLPRESSSRLAIVGDNGPIVIACARPRSRPRALGPVRFVLALMLFLGCWFPALRHIGKSALERARVDETIHAHLGELDDVVVAAGMPGTRDDGMYLLGWQIDYKFERADETIDLRVALAELKGECPVWSLAESNRLEAALDLARRCGTPKDVAGVLAFMGRYEEAATYLEPDDDSYLAITIAIATSQWKRAAEALEKTEPASCLAALFRTYAGDRDAFARASDPIPRRCALIQIAALPPEQQATALPALKLDRDDSRLLHVGRMLWYASTGHARYAIGGVSDALMPGLQFGNPWLWLTPLAFETADQRDPETTSFLHGELSALAILRGDIPTARTELSAADNAAGLDDYVREELTSMIGIAEGRIDVAEGEHLYDGLRDLIQLRSRGRVDSPMWMDYECKWDCKVARVIAQAGDGAALARYLRTSGIDWSTMSELLLGVLPLVTTHRAELVAAARFARDERAMTNFDTIPFRLLKDVATYRDVSRLAGDTEETRRWSELFDRHASILSDRRRVIAFVLWTEL